MVRDVKGFELLQYNGNHLIKHYMSKGNTRWRCPLHRTGCRVAIISCMIDGYVMVNKPTTDIIHTDHKGKAMKRYNIQT